MTNAHDIREDLQVIGSDGGMVGRVDHMDGDRIKLKRATEAGGGLHHFIPLAWVARVDDHVHLDRPAASVRDGWEAEAGGATAGVGAGTSAHAAPAADAYSRRKSNWLVWLAIGAVILVGLYGLIRGFTYTNDSSTQNKEQTETVDAVQIAPADDNGAASSGNQAR